VVTVAVNVQPAARGHLSIVHRRVDEVRAGLVRDDEHGHYRRSRAGLLLQNKRYDLPFQQRFLAWLRDNISAEIPRAYYRALLGHDLHVSMFAELYVEHFHATERDPFTGELGWLENVGLVSRDKVTTAFRIALHSVTINGMKSVHLLRQKRTPRRHSRHQPASQELPEHRWKPLPISIGQSAQ
jgi:hypothetical protein